jgi:hypothetical protein
VLGAGYGASVQGPLEFGGAVPQTAVILVVTRRYSSGLLKFAAHFARR